MSQVIVAIMVSILIIDLYVLGTNRLNKHAIFIGVQGILLSVFAVLAKLDSFYSTFIFFALLIFVFKGIIFPWFLLKSLAEAHVKTESRPYVSFAKSLVVGFLAFLLCMWLATLMPLGSSFPKITVPVSLFTIFVGLFVIVSRKKAITQLMGYLIFENGIFLFGLALASHIPILVEAGILLDTFVALRVMGIAINHINKEFEDTDVNRLNSLKG